MQMSNSAREWDLIIMGGGLASGLLFYRLKMLRPHLNVLVVEKNHDFGRNHTWSFHSSDLSLEELTWIQPFISKSWLKYSVLFPRFSRSFETGYHSIRAGEFHDAIQPLLAGNALLGQEVVSCSQNHIYLKDGRVLQARCVIDARGYRPLWQEKVGFQKFVGLDVTLTEPHGILHPILMDATGNQVDGFRFTYLLPWSDRSLLIGDTCYSNSSHLNFSEYVSRIQAYVRHRGWVISSIDREESGALPIPLVENYYRFEKEFLGNEKVPCIGVRSGLFHPTTGYSLPWAVRMADLLARLAEADLEPSSLISRIESWAQSEKSKWKFFRFLNRLLFVAAQSEERYKVLEKFYQLPEELIQRFYSGGLSFSDHIKILSGKPPVHIRQLMRCVFEPRSGISLV
jgi:lycopene beta-cyclase